MKKVSQKSKLSVKKKSKLLYMEQISGVLRAGQPDGTELIGVKR